MADTTLTWLGHASFRIDTAAGKRIYVDPFLNGNPKCPPGEQTPERVDIIAVTHGHGDHVGDTVDLAQKHGASVVALVELAGWLGKQGVDEGKLHAPNKGGTVDVDGVKFTLTNAFHSGSAPDGSYAGEPSGIVVTTEDGKVIYFAGDTCVFGDMQLIGRIYEPDVAVIPIGDHYTMGPKEAAVAVELIGAKRVVPCHWGTFGLLTGTPDELERLAPKSATIERVQPGDSVTV
jgi:L-ascorbate metabolism protein UlaG (beta-lactamase superfamily)